MSLQVWLPLNGDNHDQGVVGVTMSGSPASWSDGKLGKCATFNGNTGNCISTPNIKSLNHTGNFSFCAWLNPNYTGSTAQYAFTCGRADAGGYGYGIQIKSATQIACWFGNGYVTANCKSNEWHHVAMVVDTNMRCYVDGVLAASANIGTVPTYSDGNGLGVGCFHYSSNIYPYYGSIADLRIYSHPLSVREIKEIAKGIVVHYPLASPYGTTSVNKYGGEYAEGKASSMSTGITCTALSGERGYNYKFTYTGTGTNTWYCISFPQVSFTAGKTYDYSCKVRYHSSSGGVLFYFRAARMGNDWVTSASNVVGNTDKWVEYHIRLTLQATSDRSGTSYTTAPLIEFYTSAMTTSGTAFALNLDIKDIQIAEAPDNNNIAFTNNTFNDSTIYDTAGYLSTATASGNIGFSSNTQRYDGSLVFADTSHFKVTQPLVSPQQCSVAYWIRPTSMGGYSIISSNYNNPSSGFWLAVNTEGCGLWFYNGSYAKGGSLLTANTWYHVCFVFNKGICTWYLNGSLAFTTDLTSKSTTLGIASTISIGNSYTGTSWNTKYAGNISDFRIYATALSADDIMELYHTPTAVSNTGVLLTQGEIKEV